MRFIFVATLLITAAPALAGPPQLQGQWAGREDGRKNAVSLYLAGSGIVYVDKKEVLLGTWQLKQIGINTTDFPIDVIFNRISDHQGKTWMSVLGSESKSLGVVQVQENGIRLCMSRPGAKRRATLKIQLNPDNAIVRCFDLSRPVKTVVRKERPRSRSLCLRQCIMDNQMRAVSPQIIEADCNKACRN
ncbi:MAG TPA: hypothetical protein EYN66_22040 [Myxococcales bacterium]|nr:hypothetical protein [Myxococcales bacterium]